MASARQGAKGTGRTRGSASPQAATAPREAAVPRERRGSKGAGPGVPRRALADGVVERRRATRRTEATAPAVGPEPAAAGEELPPARLSAVEHYRLERRRRADRLTGDLETLLAEAKAEYEAHINAPRAPGKGGRPRKKPAPRPEDDDDEPDDR